jgi:hypothetical protein
MELISQQALRDLIAADTGLTACLSGQRGGYRIVVQYGAVERVLCSTKQEPRIFASLDTASLFLRRLKLSKFEVDSSAFEPGRLRKARPDRAEALRRTRTKPTQGALL